MVQQGHPVYLLDQRTPGPEDTNLDSADLALDDLPCATRTMQAHVDSHTFSMPGWRIGATLTTIYAVQYPDHGLRNLLLLTVPPDVSEKQ